MKLQKYKENKKMGAFFILPTKFFDLDFFYVIKQNIGIEPISYAFAFAKRNSFKKNTS